jgi:7-cyano-7-deazaguanine synthase
MKLTKEFNDEKKEVFSVLWTGGWDSTYRMIELSRRPVIIQPIYIYGDQRLSENYEINAMHKILSKLETRKSTKATILPIKFIEKSSIPLNQEITDAYLRIRKDTDLGSQHEWLARYAYVNPGLEIGTEASSPETSRIIDAIHKYGRLTKDKTGDYYVLDPEGSTKEGMLVFGNFKFPIIDKSELDMKRNIELWGYEDVMKEIWFCHSPFFGKPCGLCHPCEVKIESGMGHLLPESALRRYRRRDEIVFRDVYRVRMKVERFFARFRFWWRNKHRRYHFTG